MAHTIPASSASREIWLGVILSLTKTSATGSRYLTNLGRSAVMFMIPFLKRIFSK